MDINSPELWLKHFPRPKVDSNKYDRGHAVVCGGGIASSGAAKLAAGAALRIGAGLVSVACDSEALPVYAASFEAVMTKLTNNVAEFSALVANPHVTAVLIGPGAGVTARTKQFVEAALGLKKPAVLDADALSVFAGKPEELFGIINSPCILTPHEGEFARLFGALAGKKTERALQAAKLSGAVVILKGAETVIAAPDGRVVANNKSTPYLATAGTGDVLAGICTGLVAQGMPAFEAASAAVWLHAQAGIKFGVGLVAEDISGLLPGILQEIL